MFWSDTHLRRRSHSAAFPSSDARCQTSPAAAVGGGDGEDRVESEQSGRERSESAVRCVVDPGRAGGRLAIRGGGVVAAATYRKREVEDEDEEAVHGAADVDAGCCCGGARRLAEVPSHTQNGPSPVTPAPAIPSRGATPPSPDG